MSTVTAPARPALSKLPRRGPGRPVRLWAPRAPIPRRSRAALMICSVLVPLAAWVAVAASGVVPQEFLPSVPAVLSAGWEMAQSGQLWTDTLASVQRILIGFGLAIVVSVPLGLVMGGFQAGQALFEPIVGLLRYLPASAFIPLLTIWLGIGEPSKWMLLFIGTVFFNTLMTADAVRQVPRSLIDVSYTLGARRGEVLRKVVVPHALPGMIDAVRVNAAAAWNFVVVAELINSTEGLGYRIARSQRFLASDRIFAVLIVIAVLGLAIDILLRVLRDRIGRWV
ncbi:ABC transporter permease [Actinoplanes sp. NPDC049118]|uniref:ABC transporter permease n=1 Tax=Actinoplanes sp. NPDC049118 TaxID=3155769 RepID=UPI0034039D06